MVFSHVQAVAPAVIPFPEPFGGRAPTDKIPSESLPSKRYQAKDPDPKIMRTMTNQEQVRVRGTETE